MAYTSSGPAPDSEPGAALGEESSQVDKVVELHARLADHVLDAVREVGDPAERHRVVGAVLGENSGFVSELAELLRESVRAMKDQDGMSFGEIGKALGFSRARAQQLYSGS